MVEQSFESSRRGWWSGPKAFPARGDEALKNCILRVTRPVFLLDLDGALVSSNDGIITLGGDRPQGNNVYPLQAYAPALHPLNLGEAAFKKRHKLQYAYVVGAMANGITSVELVEAAGRAGMIGFYGAAGLLPEEIEKAIHILQQRLGDLPFGFNLIHNPYYPALESAVVDLYLRCGIRLISASAYLNLTAPIVYYRVTGIHRDQNGDVQCPNRIVAKVSRVEVARKFFAPPPEKILSQLVEKNMITRDEAALAAFIPMADDLTAEADSGGHTDNRPAISLLPTMLALRDEMAEKYNYRQPLCVGLGGGIATPQAAAAAFAMGAAFVLTGTINQTCIEAGTSDTVRLMLAEAGQADVAMAPAADMFEMGVKVQVLKRGTMFPIRAAKLYDLYSRFDSLDSIPLKQRTDLEQNYFRCHLEEEWEQTKQFFAERDPTQIRRAEKDPKHKMALVFRSYLGRSSTWANIGDPSRKIDYQIWCGPAIGAFNQWVKGSCLDKPENRKCVSVAMNLLLGASVATRVSWLRNQGATLPAGVAHFSPIELSDLIKLLES